MGKRKREIKEERDTKETYLFQVKQKAFVLSPSFSFHCLSLYFFLSLSLTNLYLSLSLCLTVSALSVLEQT